jgi:conjugative relaxase-like TrwC/TraI family protein
MLSIGVMAGGQGRYYSDLAKEDYYLQGGEPVGKWWGKGAAHFGLENKEVTAASLTSLLDGFSPEGLGLVQNAGGKANRERRPGFDLTFSAPKTVSALWATSSPEIRKEIQAAQDAAVKTALNCLEKTAAFTRTGKGGVNYHHAVITAALFEHGTSRALDPQLHTHALLMNLGVMEDGRVRALVHTEFFAMKMAAGAVYRVQLAEELQKRLGVSIEQDPHAYRKGGLGFKVVGVSEALCDFWSKRRDAILEQLGEWGLESAAAAAGAAKATRESKGILPPRGELFERWKDEARSFGILPLVIRAFQSRTEQDIDATFETALAKTLRELTANPESRIEAKTIGGRLVVKAVDAFLGGDDERTFGLNHFTETVLLHRLAENCQGKGIDASTMLDKFAEAVEKSPLLVRLGRSNGGEQLLTTQESLKREDEMLASAEQLNAVRGHGVTPGKVTNAIDKYNRKNPKEQLGPEREAAIKYLTDRESGSIRCLEGLAGTAKTTTLAIVKGLYEKAGYRVVGTAVAGKAVKALRESGKPHSPFSLRAGLHHTKQMVRAARGKTTEKYAPHIFKNTHTLALFEMLSSKSFAKRLWHDSSQLLRAARGKPTFKYKPLKLNSKTVVICDEASMVDTRQLAMLTERVSKAGGLFILAGDRQQIQAVGQGGGFAHLGDKFGKVQITEIVRQKLQIDRDAVKDVIEGRVGQMLKNFKERNLLAVEDDRDKAIDKLVKDWSKFEHGRKKRESLIFVGTNEDADIINRRCQKATLEGTLVRNMVHTSSRGQTFHMGDRVLFRAKSYAIGVENGETGTIVAINPTPILKTLKIKLDDGKKVIVPLRDYKHLSLGYAVTTHKGQGSTVDRAYVLLGGNMQDQEISYVQASRAKHETRLYTSQADAGEENKNLAKQMQRSNAKSLAITEAAELDRRHQEELERLRQERMLQHTMKR